MSKTGPVQAAVYCRMSLARFGDTTKVEDQERICRELAARHGWVVFAVYCDNSVSAWQKNRKRKEWDRMLADIAAGKIGAIVTYHGDRMVRQPEDLEVLIKLADTKGIRVISPTGSRDLDNKDDRAFLRVIATFACHESDRTSERKKSQHERMRRAGLVRSGGRGGRAYGFATDGVTHVGEEGAFIREAAARILAGEPTLAICRDLNARGARMPTGRPFDHGAMKKMLLRPRYAGLMPDGVHEAAWPPVLDRVTWEAVCAVLTTKAGRFGYATNARRYLLSGIARCGACGSGLQIRVESRRTHLTGYGCVQSGCRKVQRSMELLDEYVITRVLAKLGDERNPAGRFPEHPGLPGEFRALALRRTETETAINDPEETIPLPLLRGRLKAIDERLAQLREVIRGDAQSRLLGTHAGLTREQFDALPLATRRALVAACFTITVLPASKRGPGFRTEDVRLTRPDRDRS